MIQDKDIAQKTNLLMLNVGARIDESISMVKDKCSKEEFEAYRKAAGKVMGEILLEILNPIYKVHHGLKPQEMK